jgi:hypothetical protein
MTPDVRVVRGAPDDDELAALVAGLAAGSALAGAGVGPSGRADLTAQQARRRWRDAAQHLADPLRPGPDAWRWSARG